MKAKTVISLRELQRRYDKLIEKDKGNFIGMVNNYVCPNNHRVKTLSIHNGVTPFMLTCTRCGGPMRSTFFKDELKGHPPHMIFYRPTFEECMRIRKKGQKEMLMDVLEGALLMKPYNPKEIKLIEYESNSESTENGEG